VLRRWWFRLALIFALASAARAGTGCKMAEILKDPQLASNSQLWTRIADLHVQYGDQVPDSVLADIIKEFRKLPVKMEQKVVAAARFMESPRLSVSKAAMKEIENLPQSLRGKVDEFLEAALKPDGFREFYNNPGRWHFEQVREGMTVRLNSGYRVLFRVKDSIVEILRVNKGQIHGN